MIRTISLLASISVFLMTATLLCARSSKGQGAGADTFKAKCAVCHGADGSGNTPMGQKMKLSDLRSPNVQKQSDDELTAIITKGKPPMPAYGKSLSPADIRQLVAYIRSIAAKN